MSTLDDWITQAATALDVPADAIPADLRNELLDLTRDVAHGVARVAGPLTCYLVGIAVGRGADPSAALTALSSVVPQPVADPAAMTTGPATTGPAAAG